MPRRHDGQPKHQGRERQGPLANATLVNACELPVRSATSETHRLKIGSPIMSIPRLWAI